MKYYFVEPDVPGQLGENIIMDVSKHPPVVSELHYDFDDWDGDVLVTSFPCYLLTAAAMQAVEALRLSGATSAPVTVTTTETFDELHPGESLPPFVWLKVHGKPCVDDFGLGPRAELFLSERALQLLRHLGIPHAEVNEV